MRATKPPVITPEMNKSVRPVRAIRAAPSRKSRPDIPAMIAYIMKTVNTNRPLGTSLGFI
jgi:hypothetical protein